MIGAAGETQAGYAYDAKHHVLNATNAVGDVTTYVYDAQGRLTSTTTPAGLTTTNIYFSTGNYLTNWVQTRIDIQIARTNSFTYTNDLVWTATNERGVTTSNTWDGLRRLVTSVDPRGANLNFYRNLDLGDGGQMS